MTDDTTRTNGGDIDPGARREPDPETGAAMGDRLLAREAHHRVASSLNLAAAVLRMQARLAGRDEVRLALGVAEGRIAAIARVHAYLQVTETGQAVDLDRWLGDLVPDIGAAIGAVMDMEGPGRPIDVPECVAVTLGLVVNELAMDVVRHGPGADPDAPIRVSLTAPAQDRLALCVCDPGRDVADAPGAGDIGGAGGTGSTGGTGDDTPRSGSPASDLGMDLVRSLCRNIGARIERHGAEGRRYTVHLSRP